MRNPGIQLDEALDFTNEHRMAHDESRDSSRLSTGRIRARPCSSCGSTAAGAGGERRASHCDDRMLAGRRVGIARNAAHDDGSFWSVPPVKGSRQDRPELPFRRKSASRDRGTYHNDTERYL
jgi:hypothetical protein